MAMTNEILVQDALTELAALREMLDLAVKDDNFEIDHLKNIAERLKILNRNVEQSTSLDISG